MKESVSDNKNACRKVKRILQRQTDLDAEMSYAQTVVVPSTTAAMPNEDESCSQCDLNVEIGHAGTIVEHNTKEITQCDDGPSSTQLFNIGNKANHGYYSK